jgi:hypothetical protein
LLDSQGQVISPPPYITEFNDLKLTLATIDPSFNGTYYYSIKVTESVSGFSNEDVDFEFVLTVKIYATEMNLMVGTTISNQTYLVGDPTLTLLA